MTAPPSPCTSPASSGTGAGSFTGPAKRFHVLPRTALLSLALAAACATTRSPDHEIRFDEPGTIDARAADLELAGKNDEELFAIGSAALAAGEYRRAAEAFGRISDLHPSSPRAAAALLGAGRAHEALSEWRLALERFRSVQREHPGRDADEAAFRIAECQWQLGELKDARAVLDRLAVRGDLGAADHVRALAQRGIVELDDGDAPRAERSLRDAVAAYAAANGRERIDPTYAAQAQFYLGEIARDRFAAVQVDPSRDGGDALVARLEEKAQLLLAAQDEYLRTIRMGDREWAVAAGAEIGALYDALHAEIVGAPLPAGLDAEQAHAYRSELHDRVRVLVAKAIGVYEETLAAARRTGVENAFVDRTQASLDRMKQALLTPDGEATPR